MPMLKDTLQDSLILSVVGEVFRQLFESKHRRSLEMGEGDQTSKK
jgi:hypothetical protein